MFSRRLMELREERNLTRREVAEKLNIDQTTYGKYELDKRQPDYETVIALADLFGVSVDYLLGRTDNRYQIVDLPDDYKVDPDKLVVFARATRTLPDDEMQKIREYAAMLLDKHIRDEKDKKKKE